MLPQQVRHIFRMFGLLRNFFHQKIYPILVKSHFENTMDFFKTPLRKMKCSKNNYNDDNIRPNSKKVEHWIKIIKGTRTNYDCLCNPFLKLIMLHYPIS